MQIYEVLVQDFASEPDDPIAPAGLRDRALLESAIGRQHTGSYQARKYGDAISNAATLTYGLCCDHAFLNGNKRTALVSMLVHLDKNRLSLENTGQDDLFDLLLSIADHSIGLPPPPRRRRKWEDSEPPARRESDEEVSHIANWIRDRVFKIKRGEKLITYRQLRRILLSFGFEMGTPSGNSIDVFRNIEVVGFLSRKTVVRRQRVGTIGYHDEGTVMAFKDLKYVRQISGLTEENGIDSAAFYDQAAIVDGFVNKYRTVLRRLARR